MVDPVTLSTAAAAISAMVDVIKLGRETYAEYFKRRKSDSDLNSKISALEKAFSTYSSEEVAAILNRIEACRKRFISEGSGSSRKECICSVLRDVRDGNGGVIPNKEWETMYKNLGCSF